MSERVWYPDGEAPPVIADPVRRDPTLSIEREVTGPARYRIEERVRPAGKSGYRQLAEAVAGAIAVTALLIAAGMLAGGVYRAIMLGWHLWQ